MENRGRVALRRLRYKFNSCQGHQRKQDKILVCADSLREILMIDIIKKQIPEWKVPKGKEFVPKDRYK